MTVQEASVALQFLQRVTLQPAEIQAFQQCCVALQRIVQPEMVVNPEPE